MNNRLLLGSKFQAETRIAIMTKNISRQFLFVLLSIFLTPFCLTAQEEFIKVRSSTRKMIVYVPSGIEQSRPLVIFIQVMKQTMHNQKNVCQPIKTINNFK